jgi:hypothetical protein
MLAVNAMISSYLLVPGFLDPLETEVLLNRSKALLDNFDIDDHPLVSGYLNPGVRTLLKAGTKAMSLDKIHDKRQGSCWR